MKVFSNKSNFFNKCKPIQYSTFSNMWALVEYLIKNFPISYQIYWAQELLITFLCYPFNVLDDFLCHFLILMFSPLFFIFVSQAGCLSLLVIQRTSPIGFYLILLLFPSFQFHWFLVYFIIIFLLLNICLYCSFFCFLR